jgi:hypothetical protein
MDEVYAQRNACFELAMALAHSHGWTVGLRHDDTLGEDWVVLCMYHEDYGEISMHCRTSEVNEDIRALPEYTREYDGATKEQTIDRLHRTIHAYTAALMVDHPTDNEKWASAVCKTVAFFAFTGIIGGLKAVTSAAFGIGLTAVTSYAVTYAMS